MSSPEIRKSAERSVASLSGTPPFAPEHVETSPAMGYSTDPEPLIGNGSFHRGTPTQQPPFLQGSTSLSSLQGSIARRSQRDGLAPSPQLGRTVYQNVVENLVRNSSAIATPELDGGEEYGNGSTSSYNTDLSTLRGQGKGGKGPHESPEERHKTVLDTFHRALEKVKAGDVLSDSSMAEASTFAKDNQYSAADTTGHHELAALSKEVQDKVEATSMVDDIRAAALAADSIDRDDDGLDACDVRSLGGATTPGARDIAPVVSPVGRTVSPTFGAQRHRPHRARVRDWRDDTDAIFAPSAFFHSNAALEVNSNKVVETIIGRGRPAETSEEMAWLFRNSMLLSLVSTEDLRWLIPRALRREYTRGEVILDADAPVQHMHLVVWGEVEVLRAEYFNSERRALENAFRVTAHQLASSNSRRGSVPRPRGPGQGFTPEAESPDLGSFSNGSFIANAGDKFSTHLARLYPGQVFGIDNCVFGDTSNMAFTAGGATSKTVVFLFPYEDIQQVLARNPRFAQGVGVAIASSVDVFGPIREFCRLVFSPTVAQNEYLPLWSILESYTRIHNVIHTKLFSRQVDTGAWGYALGRLPENVTSTFCFDLVHALPPFVASRMRTEARAADVRKQGEGQSRSRMRTAISYIRTKERRRCTWHLGMEGKTLVLLRDGFTDLLDFLTMLCVHIVESNKLRGRVQGMVHPPAIDILDEYLRTREAEEMEGRYLSEAAGGVSREVEMERVKGILAHMPLGEEEQAGLLRNWGSDTLLRIYEVMMHREEFNVRVDPSISLKFQLNPFHEWALNLRACVLEKLGLPPSAALPDNLYIDVVSSNTHCIKNLLCRFNRKYKKEILEYAARAEVQKLGHAEEWHNVNDMAYVATNGFLKEHPELKDEFNKSLEENGITVLQDTAMTGLQVDVIPVHRLDFEGIDDTLRESLHSYYDQYLASGGTGPDGESGASFSKIPTWAQVCKPIWRHSKDGATPYVVGCNMQTAHKDDKHSVETSPSRSDNGRLQHHFIINMDFAFGAQAEGICRAIFSAFGKRIRSVSVMGKAGGMRGKRGDIQLASHVLLSKSSLIIEDNQDELRNCRNQDLTAQRLQELAGPKVTVREGKVLTVTGTMLQNVKLLRYYQQVWQCIGTEMEGSYFARVIEDFYRQGIASPQLTTRFAYYTSDLPLAQSDAENDARHGRRPAGAAATLSAPMTPQEGVPPLYAIARGILENVLI